MSGQCRRYQVPHGVGLRVAVQQQQWRAMTAHAGLKYTCGSLNQSERKVLQVKHVKSQTGRYSFAPRTTRLTPKAVMAVPKTVTAVIGSANSSQAISAVQGGTRYSKLVTAVAAPR